MKTILIMLSVLILLGIGVIIGRVTLKPQIEYVSRIKQYMLIPIQETDYCVKFKVPEDLKCGMKEIIGHIRKEKEGIHFDGVELIWAEPYNQSVRVDHKDCG